MSNSKTKVIYFLGFPVGGLLVGFLVFFILDALNGPLSNMALYISLIVWGGYGCFAGIHGYLKLKRFEKVANKLSSK
ncbi:hypothetical protein BBL81_02385 [Vibrio parahaemolyticus]|uniref:hypothetical protein n=1 Tax=Vibrio parahaemolyticus TaxID=670 RepID=UPI00084B9900|nr:hypothetical protein [Vibrio parahaemolyticus]EGR1275229.1 hypothetical protein [Vibrio parahaemolyticus]EHR0229332.1 hypothetical protein [Vibrio parahaemolyticus]EIU6822278.1 hypothetical protein [Vibrio parahaemolyticus]EIU6870573.1 hypothetical protein [Vibrio parahaemolyticus]EJG2034087.1 hypothetical protein [Vibrio parahaemolyticus]